MHTYLENSHKVRNVDSIISLAKNVNEWYEEIKASLKR